MPGIPFCLSEGGWWGGVVVEGRFASESQRNQGVIEAAATLPRPGGHGSARRLGQCQPPGPHERAELRPGDEEDRHAETDQDIRPRSSFQIKDPLLRRSRRPEPFRQMDRAAAPGPLEYPPGQPEMTTTTMNMDAACSPGSKMVRASMREPIAAPHDGDHDGRSDAFDSAVRGGATPQPRIAAVPRTVSSRSPTPPKTWVATAARTRASRSPFDGDVAPPVGKPLPRSITHPAATATSAAAHHANPPQCWPP